MEGHIFSSLIEKKSGKKFEIFQPTFPLISLLISGGHTELVFSKSEGKYKKIGETLDDAVGEAYDKSARLLGISYPGGPEVSKLAESFESKKGATTSLSLPRPMLTKDNLDFSFSGLKTAVLYLVKDEEKKGVLKKSFKQELAAEFENSVSDVLVKKTKKAIEKYGAKSLIIGGGVSANKRLRKDFKELEKLSDNLGTDRIKKEKFQVFLPNKKYTGDNALMIAVAGYFNFKNKTYKKNCKKVDGNLKLK
jgi:N6-L-threonylcarbamoyladenine synthase